jgi:hypothetical protein
VKKIIFIIIAVIAVSLTVYFFVFQVDLKANKIQIQTKNNFASNSAITIEDSNLNRDKTEENADQKSNITKENKSNNDDGDIVSENAPPEKNSSKLKITDKLLSWGYAKASGRKIDTIIIHSSYNAIGKDVYNLADIISEYKGIGVSPHYIIDRLGGIYRLVSEQNIAYHAGVSKTPDGRNDVNDFSIGIELTNTKTDKPTDDQYNSLKSLLTYIKGEYKIKYVLGHSDIASGRKDDPWNFDWGKIK